MQPESRKQIHDDVEQSQKQSSEAMLAMIDELLDQIDARDKKINLLLELINEGSHELIGDRRKLVVPREAVAVFIMKLYRIFPDAGASDKLPGIA